MSDPIGSSDAGFHCVADEALLASVHLRLHEIALLREILTAHLQGPRKVWIVGSRATGRRLKPHSDLDVLIGGPPLSLAARADLVEAFSDSDLPMRVDVLEAAALDEAFRRGLLEAGAVRVDALEAAGAIRP